MKLPMPTATVATSTCASAARVSPRPPCGAGVPISSIAPSANAMPGLSSAPEIGPHALVLEHHHHAFGDVAVQVLVRAAAGVRHVEAQHLSVAERRRELDAAPPEHRHPVAAHQR